MHVHGTINSNVHRDHSQHGEFPRRLGPDQPDARGFQKQRRPRYQLERTKAIEQEIGSDGPTEEIGRVDHLCHVSDFRGRKMREQIM
jgi:hypothetical protein